MCQQKKNRNIRHKYYVTENMSLHTWCKYGTCVTGISNLRKHIPMIMSSGESFEEHGHSSTSLWTTGILNTILGRIKEHKDTNKSIYLQQLCMKETHLHKYTNFSINELITSKWTLELPLLFPNDTKAWLKSPMFCELFSIDQPLVFTIISNLIKSELK